MSRNLKRIMDGLVDQCVKQGATAEVNSNGHWRITPDDKSKPVLFFPSTPSDRRGIKNTVSDMRRIGGFDVEIRS